MKTSNAILYNFIGKYANERGLSDRPPYPLRFRLKKVEEGCRKWKKIYDFI
jgi:hypothetical protein